MKITLIYGGKSGEHEISLVSAAAIARNIDTKKHSLALIGISKSGKWFFQDGSELERIKSNENAHFEVKENPENEVFVIPGGGRERTFLVGGANGKIISSDVIFPALHGTYGEDGTIQGLFEMMDVPYVGCSTLASAITMDKEKTKSALEHAGIPVVPGLCMRRSDFSDPKRYDEILSDAEKNLKFPLFVKPCSAGSSDGAGKAENIEQLKDAIKEAFEWDDKILIEKAVNAREIECSVTGNPTTYNGKNDFEKLTAYGPGEIAPKHQFYDYDAKYNDPDGADLLIPAALPENRLDEVRNLAKKAFAALDLCGLSRVDFFIDKDTDKLYLNEINTLPGFTSISMFPKMCGKFGLGFKDLTELLINEAVARFEATRRLKTSR